MNGDGSHLGEGVDRRWFQWVWFPTRSTDCYNPCLKKAQPMRALTIDAWEGKLNLW